MNGRRKVTAIQHKLLFDLAKELDEDGNEMTANAIRDLIEKATRTVVCVVTIKSAGDGDFIAEDSETDSVGYGKSYPGALVALAGEMSKVGEGCFQIMEEFVRDEILSATEGEMREALGDEKFEEMATRGRAIVEKAVAEVDRRNLTDTQKLQALREAIGEPMEHPYTKAAGWNWMANHTASMRCPYNSDHQNEFFVKVQDRVVKILRNLAVINIQKGNIEDE